MQIRLLLGSPDFLAHIKENYLAGKKPDKPLPALTQLIDKISMKDIFDDVDAIFVKEDSIVRQVNMYLCRKHTRKTLKNIGAYFGIGESGVCQASKRIKDKMMRDQLFEQTIAKIEERISS